MEGYYTRDQYCATCHYQFDVEIEKHAKHKPGTVVCLDCHTPQTTAGGTRYSIHDHQFDFSQPEIPCRECHDQGDERLGRAPKHQWNFTPVRFPKPLTTAEACARCHADKDVAWVQEKLKAFKRGI